MVVRSRLRANTINRDDEVEMRGNGDRSTAGRLSWSARLSATRRSTRDCGLNGKKTRT